ncbi:COR domain-containing protein [Kaistella jeonii]|nr:COR domain-containing protein [Kaistella jeonii]
MKNNLVNKKIKKSVKIDKPDEILHLEKIFETTINEVDEHYFNTDANLDLSNYFLVDVNNEITALSIVNRGHSEKIFDFSSISKFDKLNSLNLTNNGIEDISVIFPKPELKYLYIGGNKLKDISSLAQCPLLEILTIWENPIKNLDQLQFLNNLTSIYCQDTLIEDMNFILPLKNLNYLNATGCRITNLDILLKSDSLNIINLSSNKIKKVPVEVAKKFNWFDRNLGIIEPSRRQRKTLSIRNNPLEYPPNSVIELGKETTRNYYETAEKFGYEPLSEGRIIFIGDGSAGKSSLIERILNDTFEQGKCQTNGIFIDHWELLNEDQRKLTFHIWDFGGQEIQHAVHKFFFTEGCLYVLVLDNRKEEEPEYWLQQIESLGGNASVLVVFNKQDDNVTEIADRKFLKEKYPNIVGFYNTSCKTGLGIEDFKRDLEENAMKLLTVDELFPNNWFDIKKNIEECTSGEQHYLDYKRFSEICRNNNAGNEKTQKLLLKYFTTIGAVTWFGDTYLNFLHVLSPKWISQGVYKIITSKKTAKLFGIINIKDFNELLKPLNDKDYTYDETHYGYILSMMKKFDLCYTPDDKNLLIPSAFGKVPKVEYSEFRGEHVRTYILQFKDYMPLALIHRFTAKKLSDAYDNNYWYSGIVILDKKSDSLAMVHADKEAKRIYVRIKGEGKLGMWEHIRREFQDITSSYAQISYTELMSLDDKSENTVGYEDLISHIKAGKATYFHSKLSRDFNVGYLIGMFEDRESTLERFKRVELFEGKLDLQKQTVPQIVLNILNTNSPTVNTQINNSITIDIDIKVVNNISSNLKGEADYLIQELGASNKEVTDALRKVQEFASDAKVAQNSGDVIEKGWGRKLKSILKTLSSAGEQIKKVNDGGEALKSVFKGISGLAHQFNLQDIKNMVEQFL